MRAAFHGLVLCALLAAAAARAQAPWPVPFVQAKQLRIDGSLGEWAGSFERVGQDASGRVEVALAYDTASLFVAARVFDDSFVRSAQPSPDEDALVLTLELPGRPASRRVELWLYAGQVGRSRAHVQVREVGAQRFTELAAARIVEGPGTRGEAYLLEADCPWKSLPGAAEWVFARAQLRLHDVDSASRTREVTTGHTFASLAFERGPLPALASFLKARDLAQAARPLDAVVEVAGESTRVLVVGTMVLLARASGALSFAELPATHAADVHAAELRDLTGDAQPELTLRVTTRDSAAVRELWLVYALAADGPRQVFGVELRRERAGGSVQASLAVEKAAPGRLAPRIVVRAGSARNLAPDQDLGPGITGIVPVATPWGAWSERAYVWDGAGFALHAEQENRARSSQLTATAPPARESEGAAAPAAASGTDSSQLVAAYRAARDISKSLRPRFAQRANLAEDARPEELALYDRECLVVGPGFRGGNDFFYFALSVQSGEQVLALFTGDVTGDERHEILARVLTQTGGVTRELLFVYSFHTGRFETLLVAEVGRSAEGHAIENEVRVLPHKGKSALQIRPGSARGWTQTSYPWRADAQPGIEPLLLPWTDRERQYCYDGRRLVGCLGTD